MAQNTTRKKVLAVASGGGHWVQLLRLRPAFLGSDVVFVSVNHAYQADVENSKFYRVLDATRWTKLRFIFSVLQIFFVLCKERPNIVISTGAAPGYAAIRIGKFFGARTIWIDSIANVEHLSMSGAMAGRHADLWLTQWSHLQQQDGPHFKGAVL
ncbi:MAG: UDP-N-acetylglucosamine--LPS N-acetylglucosamine transferase [Rhizomicrobium sp.]